MSSPPDHGWIQADPFFIPAVPWHIHTKAGQDYLLNLVETKSQRVVLTLFLHGGEPYYGRAPEGEFEVTYTYGHHWYGIHQAFGVDSRRVRLAQIQSITAGPDDSWIWELNLGTTSGTASPVSPVDSFSVSEPQD